MVSDEIDDVLADDAVDEDFDPLAEEFDGDADGDEAVGGDVEDVEDVDVFADDDEDPADETEQPAGDLAGVDAIGDDEDDEPSSEPAVDIALLEDLDEDDDPLGDDDDEEDGIQAGEFVCRSCHMAKRASALADQDAMLCRDCV